MKYKNQDIETIKKISKYLIGEGFKDQKIVYTKLNLEGSVYEVRFKLLSPIDNKLGTLEYYKYIYSLSL